MKNKNYSYTTQRRKRASIRRAIRRIPAFVLIITLVLTMTVIQPPAKAASPTEDNPILFTVKGSVGESGAIEYNITVDDIYTGNGMTFQGFSITYPAQLEIGYPPGLATTWNLFPNTTTDPKSVNAIIKTGSRTPAQLKTDLESINFTLAETDVFPSDGSTVTITATKEKVAFYQDPEGYVHYYEWVPFSIGANGEPQTGASSGFKNWWQAYNIAQGKTMQDPRYPDDPTKTLQGYLATITSEEEQKLLYSAIADWSGWLGGSRQVRTTAGYPKMQDDMGIPDTASGNYLHNTAQNKWYWACGPEAWTVYNTSTEGYLAGGPAYQYYPKGMTSVPEDAWSIYNVETHAYTYWGTTDNPEGPGTILPPGNSFVPDPNRGEPVVPLVFYNNHIYTDTTTNPETPPTDYSVEGVYSNWNNPIGGIVHIYDSNKTLAGTTTGGNASKEPNGATTEYSLQFAYQSGTFTTYTGGAGTPIDTITAGVSTSKPDTWNDYAATNTSLHGYYIEYGGYPGDPKASELVGSSITTTSEVELVMPIIVQYRSTVQNSDGTYRMMSEYLSENTLDRVQTYETHLPYVAVRTNKDTTTGWPEVPNDIPGYTPYGYVFFGQEADRTRLTINAAGDVSGFHSTNTQRIVFLYQPERYIVTFNANFPGWNSANVSPGSKFVFYDSPTALWHPLSARVIPSKDGIPM